MQQIPEDNITGKRLHMIKMTSAWSTKFRTILEENGLTQTFIEKYQLPPKERYTAKELLEEFGVDVIPQLVSAFEDTFFKLLYSDEVAKDFFINVCIRTLNNMGVVSSIFYSDEESSIVISMSEAGFTDKQIADTLGRTEASVYNYRQINEISKVTPWTDSESELLISYFEAGLTDKEISEKIKGKDEKSVWARRMRLRLLRREARPKIEQSAKDSIKSMLRNGATPMEIADKLKIPFTLVNSRMFNLGLTNENAEQWTDEEIEIMQNASKNNSYNDEQLAELLQRPLFMIKRKRILTFGLNEVEKEKMESNILIFLKYLDEEAKLSSGQIAELTKLNAGTVRSRLQRFRKNPNMKVIDRKWLGEDIGLLKQLYEDGTPIEDIAKQLNRKVKSIMNALDKFIIGADKNES